MVNTPLKQKLLLAPLQEFIQSLPVEAHKKLQGAMVTVEPRKAVEVPGEKVVACTLPMVHKGRVLVQLINMGTTHVQVLCHMILVDLYVVPKHCVMGAKPTVGFHSHWALQTVAESVDHPLPGVFPFSTTLLGVGRTLVSLCG